MMTLKQEKIQETNTPLTIIREKEVELKKYLIETQIKADKIIEDARQEAVLIKEKMAADGEKKALEYFQSELAKIQSEAEQIESTAPEVAKLAAQKGFKNLDKAIEQFKNILMPKVRN